MYVTMCICYQGSFLIQRTVTSHQRSFQQHSDTFTPEPCPKHTPFSCCSSAEIFGHLSALEHHDNGNKGGAAGASASKPRSLTNLQRLNVSLSKSLQTDHQVITVSKTVCFESFMEFLSFDIWQQMNVPTSHYCHTVMVLYGKINALIVLKYISVPDRTI